jgi:micrococcal nuclease
MVLNGYGWHFVEYSKSEDYHEAELQARAKKQGLLGDSNPIAPWEWRKNKGKI